MRQRGGFYLSLILFIILILWSMQPVYASVNDDEQHLYVGMTLEQLFERFGVPQVVAAARGNELWQDDVVFQYAQGDFYIHKDRVWQVRLKTACGISAGDRKAAVLLALGNTAEDKGDHILFSVSGKDWPLMLRVNFSNTELVTTIYIYRPDY